MTKFLVDKLILQITNAPSPNPEDRYFNAFLHIIIHNNDLIIENDVYISENDVNNLLTISKTPKLSILHLQHDDLINIPRFVCVYQPSKIEIDNQSDLKINQIPQSL